MKKKTLINSLVLGFFLILPFAIKAQDTIANARPIIGVYSLEIGGQSVLATYLSPLHYKGVRFAGSGRWSKALPFNPEHAIMDFDASLEWSSLMNPAKTARMIGLNATFSWGMSWRKKLPMNFQVTAGGAVGIGGGAYYLLRNSNNPVQTMGYGDIDIVGSVSKHFKIGKLPVLITDRVRIPSLGLFFCPGYGETYYEIYLGNHKDLIHAGWWGNNFRIDNLLSVTLDFGKTAMTVGYRYNLYTQWANNLNMKIHSNSFVIGVIPGGIGLKKRPVVIPEERIYSIY